jgi:hypothetical protein
LAAKYCVPRAAVGCGAAGAGLTATAVWLRGAMTGRKTKPPAKPMTKVTSTMMMVLPCDIKNLLHRLAA